MTGVLAIFAPVLVASFAFAFTARAPIVVAIGAAVAIVQVAFSLPSGEALTRNYLSGTLFMFVLPCIAATALAVLFRSKPPHWRVGSFLVSYLAAFFLFPLLGLALGAWAL